MSADPDLNVDSIIARLLEGSIRSERVLSSVVNRSFVLVRGCRPGKIVQMTESEVRALCLKSREIFLSQPILLELEAPLKICGRNKRRFSSDTIFPSFSQAIFTGNTPICCVCLNTEVFRPNRIICFSVITSTEANNP